MYFIYGPEEYLINQRLSIIKKKWDGEIINLTPEHTKDEIILELGTYSLFSEKKNDCY